MRVHIHENLLLQLISLAWCYLVIVNVNNFCIMFARFVLLYI